MARYSIAVEIEVGAAKLLNTICERRGMTKKAVIARMIEWFVHQPDKVQVVILSLIEPEDQALFLGWLTQEAASRARAESPIK